MAALLGAGLPLLKSLQLLEKEETNSSLKKIIQQLIAALEEGNSLSEAMKHYPAFFPQLTIGMVRAGEQAGMLALVFQRLTLLEEKEERVRRKFFSIALYPMVIFVIAIVIVVLLLTFIIPKFETIFVELFQDKTLPAATQLLLTSSHLLAHDAWWLLGGMALFFFLGKMIGHFQQKKSFLMQILWGMPLFGNVLQKKELAHVLGIWGTLLENGVPILSALHIATKMAASPKLHHAMLAIAQSIEEGDSLSLPMRASLLFPSMVTSMITVGEETGQLSAMLLKIASIYEEEVDESITRFLSISEPLLLLFLAFLIGGIVVALFLPLVNLLSEF